MQLVTIGRKVIQPIKDSRGQTHLLNVNLSTRHLRNVPSFTNITQLSENGEFLLLLVLKYGRVRA